MDIEKEIAELKKRIEQLEELRNLKKRVEELEKDIFIPTYPPQPYIPQPYIPQPYNPPYQPWVIPPYSPWTYIKWADTTSGSYLVRS